MAQKLYWNKTLAIEQKQPLFAFDSSSADLCLSLFPGAEFSSTKAAVKMHTLIDLRDSIDVKNKLHSHAVFAVQKA